MGNRLAVQGRAIIAASQRASDVVQGFVRGTTGQVRLGGVPFFIDAMISRMIGEFLNLEPGGTVQKAYVNLPELTAALEGNQIDLGIMPVGTLAETDAPAAAERFAGHILSAFDDLTHVIRRHERSVIWGTGPDGAR